MDLVSLLIVLIVVGVILYLINHYLPIDPPIKNLITIVIVLILILWLLGVLGFGHYMFPIRR